MANTVLHWLRIVFVTLAVRCVTTRQPNPNFLPCKIALAVPLLASLSEGDATAVNSGIKEWASSYTKQTRALTDILSCSSSSAVSEINRATSTGVTVHSAAPRFHSVPTLYCL